MKPYYEQDGITIFHGDCAEVLPSIDPASVGLVLADPPYGLGNNGDSQRFRRKVGEWWGEQDRSTVARWPAVHGDDKPFDPAPILRFPRIVLWGGNHYASRLPDSGGWLVWDKRKGIEDVKWPMSDAELAWTNVCGGVRTFRHRWFGLIRESEKGFHVHPTQKPVALMAWVLAQFTKPGDLILDPYCGSGPVVEAAKAAGCRCVAIAYVEAYCEVTARRLQQGVLPLGERA